MNRKTYLTLALMMFLFHADVQSAIVAYNSGAATSVDLQNSKTRYEKCDKENDDNAKCYKILLDPPGFITDGTLRYTVEAIGARTTLAPFASDAIVFQRGLNGYEISDSVTQVQEDPRIYHIPIAYTDPLPPNFDAGRPVDIAEFFIPDTGENIEFNSFFRVTVDTPRIANDIFFDLRVSDPLDPAIIIQDPSILFPDVELVWHNVRLNSDQPGLGNPFGVANVVYDTNQQTVHVSGELTNISGDQNRRVLLTGFADNEMFINLVVNPNDNTRGDFSIDFAPSDIENPDGFVLLDATQLIDTFIPRLLAGDAKLAIEDTVEGVVEVSGMIDAFPEPLPPSISCDVNDDRVCNGVDLIDDLSGVIRAGTNDLALDFNGNGQVNLVDHAVLVQGSLNLWFGDANFDGEFTEADLIFVLQGGEYQDDEVGNSGWATGDWNADGEFDTGDILTAFKDGGYKKGKRGGGVVAVPEPSSLFLVIIGFAMLARERRGCASKKIVG